MQRIDEDRTPPRAEIIDRTEVLRRLPICARTWASWEQAGVIPRIKIGRRVLYDWSAVVKALKRRQVGG